ncbi:MAG: F0F1 ATP synthase subunit delta [Rubrivivax sp.]|nr:F0F1 ATP synthase subunit delta [Rubrivivax sp.]
MAEIATIARPYAEALFQSGGPNASALMNEIGAMAGVAADPALQQFADNPKVTSETVFNVVSDVLGRKGVVLGQGAQNFLRTLLDNGRLAALPEISAQFQALVNKQSGVSDATIESAFPIAPEQLSDVVSTIERRFARKLNATVVVKPELIGGIRVVVGDEVMDTSVAARLQQMKAALTA